MFDALDKLPDDPILGVMALFRADDSDTKVDLSAGVYKDAQGNTPVMRAVKAAERRLLESESSKAYLGLAGNARCNDEMQQLIFGSGHAVVRDGRCRTLQTPGGSGGLRVASEFFNRVRPGQRVWVSDPTWANHVPLIGSAGLSFQKYDYYDREGSRVRFDAMMTSLHDAKAGDLLLLHGCCHNPTGADLNADQWEAIGSLCEERGMIPFVDFAYQGFGQGLDEDAAGVRRLADQLPELVVVASCSKNFGLYRERVGTVTVVGATGTAAEAAYSHMLRIVRRLYSMPPDHGAAIVAEILGDPALSADWRQELSDYRARMMHLRERFAEALATHVPDQDYRYLRDQSGMFSFLRTTPEQVHQLRDEHHVYLVDSGRINVAGLGEDTLDYVAQSLAVINSRAA